MAKKSRTRKARQRRQKQRRQNRLIWLVAAVIVAAVLGAAVLVVSNQPVEVFIAADLAARYEGLPRSLSEDGYPQLGERDAPVTVEEYASFSCPGCGSFHSESFDALLERVRSGQILFSYIPLQTGSIPNASGAARTALCAGQQQMFWEMHDVLFDWQTRYLNTAFSHNRLLAGIEAMGLDSGSFNACFNSQSVSNTLNAAQSEGVGSTPTVNVNGVAVTSQNRSVPATDDLLRAIDAATPNDWQSEPDEPPEVAVDEPADTAGAAESADTAGDDATDAEMADDESAAAGDEEMADDESADTAGADDDDAAADESADTAGADESADTAADAEMAAADDESDAAGADTADDESAADESADTAADAEMADDESADAAGDTDDADDETADTAGADESAADETADTADDESAQDSGG